MANLKSMEEITTTVSVWVSYTNNAFWETAVCPSDVATEVAESVNESTAAYLNTEFDKLRDELGEGSDVIDIDSGAGKKIIDGLPRAVWDGLTVKGYNGDVDSDVVDFMFTVYGESDLKDVAEEIDLAYPPESDEDRKYLVKVYFDDLVDSATQLFESEADKLPDYVLNNSRHSTRPHLSAHRHTSVHTGTHDRPWLSRRGRFFVAPRGGAEHKGRVVFTSGWFMV